MSDTVAQADSPAAGGAWLMAIAAAIGFAICLFNYLTPHGPIAGSWGALLVVVSTGLMVLASLWIALGTSPRWLFILLDVLIVIDVLGTGFCAYMLEADAVLAFMVIALIGWFWHLTGDRPRVSVR